MVTKKIIYKKTYTQIKLMTENKLKFTSKENEILKKYTKIFLMFFKYSIYIILLIIVVIIFTKQINKYNSLDIQKTFALEEIKLIWEFQKITDNTINNNDIKIHILQGTIKNTWDFIFSTNNLIEYKDFVMPNNSLIYNDLPIKDKSQFNSWYDIKDIENFMQNIVFTNSETLEQKNRIIITLPLKETIFDTFYLNCTNDTKLINSICNNYIQNFLNTFYIYDIPKDYDWLKQVFENIKTTKYKKPFCDKLKIYILYSNDTNKILEDMFISCWTEYIDKYQTLNMFFEIKDQLEKWYINETLYQNNMLNNYKLISYQQIIYNDLLKQKINSIRFDTYITYLQSILKKPEKIDAFYIDTIYRFNNYYIKNVLNNIKYKTSDNKKDEIDNILKNIEKLNNWDELLWYQWLKDQITNKDIILTKNNSYEIIWDYNEENNILDFVENIKNFSFIKIIKTKISWDKVKVWWYFSIENWEQNETLYSSIILNKKENKLIIEKINVDDYEELNKALDNIIKIKEYTIPEIYEYIKQNIYIFESKDNITTCELIQNNINSISEWDDSIKNLNLMECNSQKISILKEQENEESTTKIYYKITLDNFNITNIMISDKNIETDINNMLKNINTNNVTINNIIWQIITYTPEQKTYIQQWSNNIIITIEDLKQFLGIVPNDVAELKNEILLDISIQWTDFVWKYNTKTKELWPIYFKVSSEIEIEKTNLEIKWFNLILREENINTINSFTINPIKFIQNIDPKTLNYYESIISQ